MANNKQMTVVAFQNKLKTHYIENGEVNVESRVETLCEAIVKNNKENNPFLFDMFFSVIKAQGIKLGELVESNGKVRIEPINEIVNVVQNQTYRSSIETDIPEEQIKNDIEIDEKIINQLKNIDYTKPLSADDLELIANNMNTWLTEATVEQKGLVAKQVTEGQEADLAKFVDEFLLVPLEQRKNPEVMKELANRYYDLLKRSGLLSKDEILDIEETDRFAKYIILFNGILKRGLEADFSTDFSKILLMVEEADPEIIKCLDEHGYNRKEQYECIRNQIIMLEEKNDVKSINPDSRIPMNDFDKIIMGRQIRPIMSESKKLEEMDLQSVISQPILDQITFNAKGYSDVKQNGLAEKMKLGVEKQIVDMSSTQVQIEMYFDNVFEELPDFYTLAHESKHKDSIEVDGTEIMYADASEELDGANNQEEKQAQALDEEEQTPTFESKTALEKLVDKMSGSKNPLAQKLAQSLMAFKNRDKARLNSASTEKKQEDFKETSSKGRFGAGDSSLMPAGTGLRNSFIRAGEGLMKLFHGKAKEQKPEKSMIPINPSEAVWSVSKEVIDNTTLIGKQAGQKQAQIVEGNLKQNLKEQRADDGDTRSEIE